MCGRTGFIAPENEAEVWERYELSNQPKLQTTYNLAPSMKALVVHRNSPNIGEYLPFGIKAPWSQSMLLINAQSETVYVKRTFKDMFENYRCLIPASFYYEWKRHEDKTKTPYLFKVTDQPYFSFAGLYKPGEGFVILTCQPNEVQLPIHHRMPVILDRELEQLWLNEDQDADHLMEMLRPYSNNNMECFPVSSLVNSPRNQSVELLKPIEITQGAAPEQQSLLKN